MSESRFTNVKKLKYGGIQTICCDSSGLDTSHILINDTQNNVLKYSKSALTSTDLPIEFSVKDETTGAISWHGENVCIGYTFLDFLEGTDDKFVGKFNKQLEKSSDLLKFGDKVTVLDVNSEYVVAGSSDSTLKVSKLNNNANSQSMDLNGQPLSIKIDPKSKFVAVSTTDGVVTILNVKDFEVIQIINNLFTVFDEIETSTPRITISWSKNGDFLYIPSANSVKVIERNTWNEVSKLETDKKSEIFSITCLSKNGKYIAASTMNNEIIVWDTSDKKVVSSSKYTEKGVSDNFIVSICFAPFSDDIVVADSNAGICLYQAQLSSEVLFEPEDDDSITLNRTSNPNTENFGEDDFSRLSSTSDDIAAIKKKYGFLNENPIDFENIDDNVSSSGDVKEEIQNDNSKLEQIDYNYSKLKPKKNLIPEQFISGSAPFKGCQKCLKYNMFGIVRLYIDERTKINTIDIEYHDKSKYPDKNLDNFETNYEMADLSAKAIALASYMNVKKEKKLAAACLDEVTELNNEENVEGTSTLYVIPISSFGKQEWKVKMPKGEGIVDVLTSNTQIYVVTTLRNVRVFSLCGMQRLIFNHPAPILTCACFNNTLAIASAAGAQFVEKSAKDQELWKIEVSEYSIDSCSWFRNSSNLTKKYDVPVKNGEELEWLSYSKNGRLVAMDSSYSVHILSASSLWIPIFDGSKIVQSKSDGLFAVQVVEGKKSGEFRYIVCREQKFPQFDGREVIKQHKWQAPFCQAKTDRAENEQELFFNEMAICDALADGDVSEIDKLDKEHLVTIVKLFSLSVKSNADGRSAELASLVTSSKGISALANFANKHKKVALAEKVAEIGRQVVNISGTGSTKTKMIDESNDDEFLKPKRITLNNRKEKKEEEKKSEFAVTLEAFNNREENESEIGLVSLDDSDIIDPYDSQPQSKSSVSTRIGGMNPFKKMTMDEPAKKSGSVLDELENIATAKDRKRTREETDKKSEKTIRKQAKLTFSSKIDQENTNSQKEEKETISTIKKITPYDLWLEGSIQSLKKQFSGQEDEFSKFCIQKFRGLSKLEKQEWKKKAEESITDV